MKRVIVIAIMVLAVMALLSGAAQARRSTPDTGTGSHSYVDNDDNGVAEEDTGSGTTPDGGTTTQCIDKTGKEVKGPDADKDGICDDIDNCPKVANPKQEDEDQNDIGDVCEGDGGGENATCVDKSGNACDACPEDADMTQKDSDGNVEVDECPSPDKSADTGGNGMPTLDAGEGCSLIPAASANALSALICLAGAAVIAAIRRKP